MLAEVNLKQRMCFTEEHDALGKQLYPAWMAAFRSFMEADAPQRSLVADQQRTENGSFGRELDERAAAGHLGEWQVTREEADHMRHILMLKRGPVQAWDKPTDNMAATTFDTRGMLKMKVPLKVHAAYWPPLHQLAVGGKGMTSLGQLVIIRFDSSDIRTIVPVPDGADELAVYKSSTKNKLEFTKRTPQSKAEFLDMACTLSGLGMVYQQFDPLGRTAKEMLVRFASSPDGAGSVGQRGMPLQQMGEDALNGASTWAGAQCDNDRGEGGYNMGAAGAGMTGGVRNAQGAALIGVPGTPFDVVAAGVEGVGSQPGAGTGGGYLAAGDVAHGDTAMLSPGRTSAPAGSGRRRHSARLSGLPPICPGSARIQTRSSTGTGGR